MQLAQVINFDNLDKQVGTGLEINGKGPGSLTLADIVTTFIPFLLGAAGFLLLLYLIWGGFMWMTSAGDPKAIEAAKTKVTSAVVGFVLIFLAYWLVQLLGIVFGLGQIGDVLQ